MTPDKFQALKHKTTHEQTLSDVWLYYMDNFTDHAAFVEMGDRTQDEILEAIIAQVCQQMGVKERIDDILLVEIPEQSFIHGAWFMGDRIGNILYFQDTQIGIIAVPNSRSESAEVQYARFTNPVKDKAPANINLN